ncbi:MAG: hypothetical protein AAGF11_09205 [Myxococcota bacterium]
MDRLLRTLGIVLTVALVGYAAWLLLVDTDADDVVDSAIADAKDPDVRSIDRWAQERRREVDRRLALSPASSEEPVASEPPPESAAVSMPEGTAPYGSGEIDAPTARQGFEHAMDRVDAVIDARRRISQDQWHVLYRETNDAFSALSIVLDASDEEQLAELEAAHQRLLKRLRRVRVRGRKFSR